MECLYTILEVEKTATHDEIKRSYRALALKYHPDKCTERSEETDAKFVKIKEAYEILGDTIKRNIYDQNSSKMKFDDILQWKDYVNSIIKTIYTIMKKNVFPEDITIKLSVSIGDIYNGKVKKLSVKVKRWHENEYVTSNENIYVDLVNFKSEYVFIEKGDASIFKGVSNSNIRVIVMIKEEDMYISDLLSQYDLCIRKEMSLKEFYSSEYIEIEGLSEVEVKNERKESYVLTGVGLPYVTEEGDRKRGDIYITINISVPIDVPSEFIELIKTI